ncbi:hypothetical protein CYY_000375 [Polysphondylium violaceum]|uniref:BEACH domain-containing protein n=1 Tax=Polysphondylium violaceum TaxID=133409 RepID=A0A8J4V5L6_9MYCE|nr:hypothetical protein CYY_000375 [Polysphondylium violaceum]
MFTVNRTKLRFSLILMEEGEYYFDDYNATFYPPADTEEESWAKRVAGRVLICSNSIFFEPDDNKLPIMRMPFKEVLGVGRWLNSASSAPTLPSSSMSQSLPPPPSSREEPPKLPPKTAVSSTSGSALTRFFSTIPFARSVSTSTTSSTLPNPTTSPISSTPTLTNTSPIPSKQNINNNSSNNNNNNNNNLNPFDRRSIPTVTPSYIASKVDVFYIKTTQIIEMKEGNKNAPYVFKTCNLDLKFSLSYTALPPILETIKDFLQYSKKEKTQHENIIKSLIEDRENKHQFDLSLLVDLNEKSILELKCSKISPLVENPGRLLLTNARLYFQPMNNIEGKIFSHHNLESITRVQKRRHSLREIGLELFFDDNSSLFFKFGHTYDRDRVYNLLVQHLCPNIVNVHEQKNYLLKWQNGIISNYDYLIYLNNLAGRTYNDLTQYPVFPWIIQDYTSSELDLTKPETYRDLSKPIGALNPARLATFQQRYHHIPDGEPKFLYGTHYSAPAYVLYYLVRQAPEYMLRLQNGSFDQPSRMFHSIQETWNSVMNNSGDVKELIPEFYKPVDAFSANYCGEFLVNTEQLDLGVRDHNEIINDVVLPPWANNSPKEFVTTLQKALESDYVSSNLHHWIDLIFGHKQKGTEAVKANNLFYHLTYEGAVDIESITDPFKRQVLESQINEFGQTPRQLFTTPHPQRLPQSSRNQNLSIELNDLEENINHLYNTLNNSDELINSNNNTSNNNTSFDLYSFNNNNSNSNTSFDGFSSNSNLKKSSSVNNLSFDLNSSMDYSSNNNNNSFLNDDDRNWGSLANFTLNQVIKGHKDRVTALCLSSLNPDILYSVSKDSLLKIYSLREGKQNRSLNLCGLALSSIQLSRDEKYIIIGSWDDNIYVYSVQNGSISYSLAGHSDAVSCLKLHKNMLVSGSWDSSVKVWRVERSPNSGAITVDLRPMADFVESESEITCLDISPDGMTCVAGSKDGHIYFYDLVSLQMIRKSSLYYHKLTCIKYTPDGSRIVTSCVDGSLKLIGNEGSEIFGFQCDDKVYCLDTDGSTLVVGTRSGLRLWSLTTGTEIKDTASSFLSQSSQDSIRSLCVTMTNGRPTLLTGTLNGSISIWSQSQSS